MALDRVNSGRLRHRVTFEQRTLDANGDRLGPWAPVYTCGAMITYLHGGETVMADRLQSKLPAIITVRHCTDAIAIDATCRAKWRRGVNQAQYTFTITGQEPRADSPPNSYIDIMAVQYVGQTAEA
jgi:head-tail adaptor